MRGAARQPAQVVRLSLRTGTGGVALVSMEEVVVPPVLVDALVLADTGHLGGVLPLETRLLSWTWATLRSRPLMQNPPSRARREDLGDLEGGLLDDFLLRLLVTRFVAKRLQ